MSANYPQKYEWIGAYNFHQFGPDRLSVEQYEAFEDSFKLKILDEAILIVSAGYRELAKAERSRVAIRLGIEPVEGQLSLPELLRSREDSAECELCSFD